MTKEKYLEDLYQELQKYETDSTLKHVTEYDYLISDMLEDSSIEEVITKLGTSEELAASIAEEFDYNLKKSNQFEDPILNRKKDYSAYKNNDKIAKVINLAFKIVAIIFWIAYIVSALGTIIVFAIAGTLGLPTLFWYLTLGAFTIFVYALYKLIQNVKNLLVNRLIANNPNTNYDNNNIDSEVM